MVGCQTAASPGQGGGGEGGRDGWRRERREGRMGGRWEVVMGDILILPGDN